MAEWEEYRCRIPKEGDRFRLDNCSRLTEVHHIVHVPDACRIIEDGRLKAGLVYDESRVNTTRLSVTWTSPNSWQPSPGSIYGTVQFTFDWSDVLDGRHIYWVEAIKRYHPHAYRFLLSDRRLGAGALVQPYDPETAKGPLRRRGGTWWWNSRASCEFMLEADLSLELCRRLEFINHRQDGCRLYGRHCVELTAPAQKTGARVVAHVLGRGLASVNRALIASGDNPRAGQLSMSGDECGVGGIWLELAAQNRFGGDVTRRHAEAFLKGALLQLAAGNKEGARELAGLLESEEVFDRALERLVGDHFGLPGYRMRS